MKKIVVFGSTGSVGRRVLEVVRESPDMFRVVGLACKSSAGLLASQAAEFGVEAVYIESGDLSGSRDIRVFRGNNWKEFLESLDFDVFVSASSGTSGFLPTFWVLSRGKKVLLANKETVVMGGKFITPYLDRIVPLDSEHSSIFRMLRYVPRRYVKSIYLTASGGPFLEFSREEMGKVTPDQAVRHPNWPMGKKISVDSATMMNKGLEVIEAHFLFGFPPERIKIIIHKESVVHAFLEIADGTLISHMYPPDMKFPIKFGLFYPEVPPSPPEGAPRFSHRLSLSFDEVDEARFPAISLCYKVLSMESTAPIVLNAANEVAVSLFLSGKIGFNDIPELVKRVLDSFPHREVDSLDDVLSVDEEARSLSRRVVASWKS